MVDLGKLGEKTLDTWATERDIRGQKVSEDCHGWDYLLEFSRPQKSEVAALPRDREPAPLSCLVQVKTTGKGRLSCQVKLDNWEWLVKHPLPAFFLFLDFGINIELIAAYLVPVDESWIRKVLKRIRELDSQSEGIAKHRLSVKCHDRDKLMVPNAASFEETVRRHIGSLEEYTSKKAALVKAVGYETGRGLITFTITEESLRGTSFSESMIDLSLGLRGPLEITHAEFRDVRFDIPSGKSSPMMSQGEISIIQKPSDCVDVTLGLGTSATRLSMDMFLPRGLGKLIEMRALRVLLKRKFVELVISDAEVSISLLRPDYRVSERLSDLNDMASVVLLLREASMSATRADLSVRRRGEVLIQGKLGAAEGISSEIIEISVAVKDAWIIAKYLDINEIVELPVDRLLLQKEALQFFSRLLTAEIGQMRIRGFLEDVDLSRLEHVRVFIPFGAEVELGDYRAVAVVSMWGNLIRTGLQENGQIEFETVTREWRIEKTFAARSDEEPAMSLSAAVGALADAQDGPCLILPQFTTGA